MSERLRVSLERAFDAAAEARAAEVAIEHLLLAFDEDVDVNVYLAGCGVGRGEMTALFDATPVETRVDSAAPSASPASWGAEGENRAGRWESDEGPYGSRYASSAPGGYGGGYAASAGAAARLKPSRALRRLMAMVSQTAEKLGREAVASELVVQVLALDEATAEGRRLAALLPEAERARLAESFGGTGLGIAGAGAAASGGETSFKTLASQIESLLMTLHGELQKDMRYRIANDLAAFMTQTRPGEEALQASARPILHATRAELERDPHFLALEHVRGVLRTVRMEENQIRAALGGLMREGRLEAGGALAEAAAKLVSLPATESVEPQDRPELHEPQFSDEASEARSLGGLAIVHAAREGASPWDSLTGVGQGAEPILDEAPLDEEARASADEADLGDVTSNAPKPILNRVLRVVRPGSVFSRRRSGAA